ncbi:unnamed protein product [Strongylus vulgaris]|uniref:Uncharacterized protein n=1 Tax=Strongylus vulgaris TaxID=40348 RepID=A0A3P7J0B2_STRVU|nr:unnamed protein product [Strongylus vulgaris]
MSLEKLFNKAAALLDAVMDATYAICTSTRPEDRTLNREICGERDSRDGHVVAKIIVITHESICKGKNDNESD